MIPKRYPGLFNIFADSNQTSDGAFYACIGSLGLRDFSSHSCNRGCPLQLNFTTCKYNCNRQVLIEKTGREPTDTSLECVGFIQYIQPPPNPKGLKVLRLCRQPMTESVNSGNRTPVALKIIS